MKHNLDEPKTRRRLLAVAVAITASAVVTGTGITLAYLSDSKAVPGNTVQAGTVLIDSTAWGTPTTIATTKMQPGDTKQLVLTIKNGGTVNYRYRIVVDNETNTTNTLMTSLKAQVTSSAGSQNASYAGPTITGLTAPKWLAGDTATAPDKELVLAPGQTDTDTVNVTLPTGYTDNNGLTGTFDINVYAEQTANNTFASETAS